ncbi:amine oxidase [Plakobranchus ocellatus]|uniref:Amine oxidase n=1 Tax=Plakobranchus ocellatus TaxID=259542 RepID=A0AAV4BBG6_9GAST|nr:amine oxidase [Plakobranchus ocellatus]
MSNLSDGDEGSNRPHMEPITPTEALSERGWVIDQRQAMEDLTADNIVTQMVDFVDSYGQTHRAAFGRVTNIATFVTKLLEQHKLKKTLTWLNSTIPQDEVWIKF